jgi:hypothetical protein
MAIFNICSRTLTNAAALFAVAGGLVAAPVIAGPSPWVRFIATELESEATSLATIPPSTIDALLQAKISTSNNGQYWAAEVITLQNAVTGRAAISGTRNGIDFALHRLQNIPGLNVAFEASASGIDPIVLVNNAGDISISGNLTSSTTTDEAIILYRRSDQQYSFVAREGSPIPGFVGESFGGGLDQRTLTENGRVLFRDSATVGSLPAAQDEFLFLGGTNGTGFTTIAQGGVLTPTGQSIQPNVVMPDIELGYACSDDGQNYITRGILQRTAPNVVAVRNGAVVMEQGQALPGAAVPTPEFSTALAITDSGMGPSGDWYVAGRALPTGTGLPTAPWLVFNNRIIYSADADFPGGLPGERVSNLNGISITTRGDLFYSISTVATEFFASRTIGVVIPVTGDPIVAYQSGTPIDFNRNNDPSDDFWFISNVFSAVMADDGTIYLITRYLNVGDVIGYIPVNLSGPAPARCNAADIANDDGSPLPPAGPAGGTNNGVTEGDYNLFFATYFDAGAACDIANDDGSPLPPFGTLATNNGVTEGDYNLFFAIYFDGCSL